MDNGTHAAGEEWQGSALFQVLAARPHLLHCSRGQGAGDH